MASGTRCADIRSADSIGLICRAHEAIPSQRATALPARNTAKFRLSPR